MNKRKSGTATRATRRGRASRTPPSAVTEHKTALGTFAFAAECTVADAEALKNELARLLDSATPVTLDISAVRRIDTAGLQVITSFVRERESRGQRIEWRGAAPALTSAAQLLGLESLLKLPTGAGAAVESNP